MAISGTVAIDGRKVRYLFPLISQPVRVSVSVLRQITIVPAGAPELTPLVTDPDVAGGLEQAVEHDVATPAPLEGWIREVVAAAGLPPVTAVLPPSADPLRHRTDDGLVAVVGALVYVARDVYRPSAEAALRSWAGVPGIDDTALAHLYERPATGHPVSETASPEPPVCTPLRLSPTQTEAVVRARHDRISVISGPPGSGKSHTVAAIATDTVAHGGSVLIATRSEHAADVVASLLARRTGPDPVRFAGTQNDDLVRRSTERGTSDDDAATAARALAHARAQQRLATALRAGRHTRRRLLRQLDGSRIVAALPLWVGTLRDVEDLLPDTPGLFDLVVLDEASQIDQVSAAGALLRARRAVVVGDPHQLRHVSFVSEALVARTTADHGLSALAARLDVRRASALDVAAGAAPMTWLDEHHRSVPHLIDFSARRFYDGRLTVVTRHPANESTDAIAVRRVPPGDTAELDAALAEVARQADTGRTDIAIVSPFRALADAAQAELLAAYQVEDVERLRLRVGTVHEFQGAEADHVVLLLGLAPSDGAGRRRFVEDPHLFNVMVTRARRTLTVVTALPPVDTSSSSGLVEQYLAHADRPPRPPGDGVPPSAWAAAVARELAGAGVAVRTAYPVGRWTVDLCVGSEHPAAVDTGVHPDGPAAHIARHRTLAAAGWRHADGFASRWDGEPTRAAVELARAADPADADYR